MLRVQRELEATILELGRPERGNSLGPTMGRELLQQLSNIGEQLETWAKGGYKEGECPGRALIIRAELAGRNRDVWIAGGDLQELAEIRTKAQVQEYCQTMAEIGTRIAELPIPVIAEITGKTIGGGLEFALGADIRLAGPGTQFHFKQMNVGLALGYQSSHRLVSLLGSSKATHLLLTGAKVEGGALQRLGLVQELFPDRKSLREGSRALIQAIAKLDPRSVAAQKRMLRVAEASDLVASQKTDSKLFADLWRNPSHEEFLKAFQSRSASTSKNQR